MAIELHRNGVLLRDPEHISNQGFEVANKLARLSSQYSNWHRELLEAEEDGDQKRATVIALSLAEIQKQIDNIAEVAL